MTLGEGSTIWYTAPGTESVAGFVSAFDNRFGIMELDFGPQMLRHYRVSRDRWGWVTLRDPHNTFDLDPIS